MPVGRSEDSTADCAFPKGKGGVSGELGLVELPGGEYSRGTHADDGDADDCERPSHQVRLAPFAIARHTVTNDVYAHFVEATGYRTAAEESGWSFVFGGLLPNDFPDTRGIAAAPWWRRVNGADWRRPRGPHSDLTGIGDHPVLHLSWFDAVAFCNWSGTRLPTESEWEYAARGGRHQQRFPWGDELEPGGVHRMNVFQGTFPGNNTAADGYAGTCPVDEYEPNDFGVYNTTGNVWEWCADWFSPNAYESDRRDDPTGPDGGTHRVVRGGSYLCHHSYCERYRVAARSASTPDSTTGNVGFRVARSTRSTP